MARGSDFRGLMFTDEGPSTRLAMAVILQAAVDVKAGGLLGQDARGFLTGPWCSMLLDLIGVSPPVKARIQTLGNGHKPAPVQLAFRLDGPRKSAPQPDRPPIWRPPGNGHKPCKGQPFPWWLGWRLYLEARNPKTARPSLWYAGWELYLKGRMRPAKTLAAPPLCPSTGRNAIGPPSDTFGRRKTPPLAVGAVGA